MNLDILKKAQSIIDEKKYINTCITANICPECGEILKSYRKGNSSEWLNITECSINPNHYRIEDYDCDDGDDY